MLIRSFQRLIGVALGVIATLMHHIPDDVFLIAARELAASVRDEDLEHGSLYPPLDSIREVSLKIAIGITKYAYCKGMNDLAKKMLKQFLVNSVGIHLCAQFEKYQIQVLKIRY